MHALMRDVTKHAKRTLGNSCTEVLRKKSSLKNFEKIPRNMMMGSWVFFNKVAG